jgi:hypothetical protein
MTPSSNPPVEVTEHAACPWCRYDLFGLPEEKGTVRCPECGNRVKLGLLRIPPLVRLKKVRSMETLPAFCAVSFWGSLYLGVVFFRLRDASLLLIPAGWAVLWTFCVWAYLRRYRLVVGAAEALVLLHLCVPLLPVGAVLSGYMPLGIAGALAGNHLPGLFSALGWWLLGVATLALGLYLYRRVRRTFRSMHDQLAGRVLPEPK